MRLTQEPSAAAGSHVPAPQRDQIGQFRAIWALFQSSWQFFPWSKSLVKMAIIRVIFQNNPKPFFLMLGSFSSQPKIAILGKFSKQTEQILKVVVFNFSRQKSSLTILFKTKWSQNTKAALRWSLFNWNVPWAPYWAILGSSSVKTSGHCGPPRVKGKKP